MSSTNDAVDPVVSTPVAPPANVNLLPNAAKEEESKPPGPPAATTNLDTGPLFPKVESNVAYCSRSKSTLPDSHVKEGLASTKGSLAESLFTGKTCMQCRVAKVKCDKHQPCDRCCRRGYECSAQARGPGRPPASETKKKKVVSELVSADECGGEEGCYHA
jgi:hypothetical protein